MAVIAYQYRGDLVDQIHRGHIAVTDHTGKILWKLGDPERLTFARSSAKPLQAIPVAESGALEHYGITPQELAVICSSHNGEPFHVKAVESILHKAGLSPDQLCCGSEYPMYVPAEDALKIAGIPRAPIYCDCSGKHAGMLITARHLGESLENYISPEHPVQQRILSVFAEMCGVETSDVQLAVDGCGVPVHALPLYRLAQGYARMSLPTLFAPTRAAILRRITSAMTAHPEMVAGTDRICTQLMAAFGDRIFCKSGASAFYAVGIKDKGIGIALKNGGRRLLHRPVCHPLGSHPARRHHAGGSLLPAPLSRQKSLQQPPRRRGPHRAGLSAGAALLTVWPAHKNRAYLSPHQKTV